MKGQEALFLALQEEQIFGGEGYLKVTVEANS
jgi:hypothetical protein